MKSNDYIKKTYGTCCVCFDLTKTKTACNHPVCIDCWDKIKPYFCNECNYGYYCDRGDTCGIVPCPICRQSVCKQLHV